MATALLGATIKYVRLKIRGYSRFLDVEGGTGGVTPFRRIRQWLQFLEDHNNDDVTETELNGSDDDDDGDLGTPRQTGPSARYRTDTGEVAFKMAKTPGPPKNTTVSRELPKKNERGKKAKRVVGVGIISNPQAVEMEEFSPSVV